MAMLEGFLPNVLKLAEIRAAIHNVFPNQSMSPDWDDETSKLSKLFKFPIIVPACTKLSEAFYQAPHLLSVATSWSKPAISSVLMTAWNFTWLLPTVSRPSLNKEKWLKLRPVAVQSFSMLQGRSFWWQLEFHPANSMDFKKSMVKRWN